MHIVLKLETNLPAEKFFEDWPALLQLFYQCVQVQVYRWSNSDSSSLEEARICWYLKKFHYDCKFIYFCRHNNTVRQSRNFGTCSKCSGEPVRLRSLTRASPACILARSRDTDEDSGQNVHIQTH